MNFTATLIGAALGFFFLHGPIGALIGGAIGFMFDAGRNKTRQATPAAGGFVGPLFAILGAIAKADGRISPAEITVAERLMSRMNLNQDQRRDAIESFNVGKAAEFNVTLSIEQLRNWVGARRDHAFPVLDVVIDTVLADGSPSNEKMAILRQVAFALRVSDMELMALMAMKGYAWNNGGRSRSTGGSQGSYGGGYVPPQRATQGPDPYAILGIGRDADDRAIKRAYRKLISEHHPDRLGDLPEDMRRRAESRASEINAAYERVKAERGFK